jgi:hypothetical protein
MAALHTILSDSLKYQRGTGPFEFYQRLNARDSEMVKIAVAGTDTTLLSLPEPTLLNAAVGLLRSLPSWTAAHLGKPFITRRRVIDITGDGRADTLLVEAKARALDGPLVYLTILTGNSSGYHDSVQLRSLEEIPEYLNEFPYQPLALNEQQHALEKILSDTAFFAATTKSYVRSIPFGTVIPTNTFSGLFFEYDSEYDDPKFDPGGTVVRTITVGWNHKLKKIVRISICCPGD